VNFQQFDLTVKKFWVFGSVWNFFENLDLDGHILGTILAQHYVCAFLFSSFKCDGF